MTDNPQKTDSQSEESNSTLTNQQLLDMIDRQARMIDNQQEMIESLIHLSSTPPTNQRSILDPSFTNIFYSTLIGLGSSILVGIILAGTYTFLEILLFFIVISLLAFIVSGYGNERTDTLVAERLLSRKQKNDEAISTNNELDPSRLVDSEIDDDFITRLQSGDLSDDEKIHLMSLINQESGSDESGS